MVAMPGGDQLSLCGVRDRIPSRGFAVFESLVRRSRPGLRLSVPWITLLCKVMAKVSKTELPKQAKVGRHFVGGGRW